MIAAFFVAELEKIAATRQVKIMRELFQKGDVGGVERLAKKLHEKGTLKVSGPGTQLGKLGGPGDKGAEGVAHAVVGAKGTVAKPSKMTVRKTYDPRGAIYSKEVLRRKMMAGRKLRDDPRFAKLLSKRIGRGKSGGRYMHYEHVKGVPSSAPPAMEKALHGKMKKDWRIGDLHSGNVLQTATGPKAIDYLVTKPPSVENPRFWKRLKKMKRSSRLTRSAESRGEAEMWRRGSGAGTQTHHFDRPGEIVRADPVRALRGLGRGSRQAKKIRGLKTPGSS